MPAGPLAVDVAVHEELGRHDIQSLRDVFTDALHGTPTALLLAVGVLGLMAMLDAAQMGRQRVATRLARWGLGLGAGGHRSHLGFTAQTFELRTQRRFVLAQRFLEQAALVCVHGLGLGAVGPALEPGQLEVDLLDLGLSQRDLPVLALQKCVALGQRLVTLGQLLRLVLLLLLKLGNQRGDLGRQALRIDGSSTTHALHRARCSRCKHRHIHCQRSGWRRWRSLFRPV